MLSANEILEKINEYLDNMVYDRQPVSLYDPVKYVLSMGGKRIRPTLMLMAYNLYKENPESILSSACALETYHNYTLLHDDLMDNADVRRGKTTVHKKWNANKAILSGDSMLVLSYKRMMECDEKHLKKVMDVFTETALEIGEGQEYDMAFETRNDVSEDEYIEMIRLKTSVLLACAVKIGSILADAPEEDTENLYKFGEQMGLAFQLQDDYLDVYGNPEIFGKANGGDIVSNKKTYMLINAYNHADKKQYEQLSEWMNNTSCDEKEKIDAVTKLYTEIGVDKLAENKISEYFARAEEYLSKVNVKKERKEILADYTKKMMKRKY